MAAAWQSLTEEETEKIIMATVRGQSRIGASEAEIEVAVAWAHQVRVNGALLRMVLDGDVLLEVDPVRGVRVRLADRGDVDPQRRAA